MSDTGSNRLAALVGSIRGAQQAIAYSSTAIAEVAIEAGHALIDAKSIVKHSRWEVWLRDHRGMSERSAQRYMQVARIGMKSATVADLGIRGASASITRGLLKAKDADEEAAYQEWAYGIQRVLDDAPSAAARAQLLRNMQNHVAAERLRSWLRDHAPSAEIDQVIRWIERSNLARVTAILREAASA